MTRAILALAFFSSLVFAQDAGSSGALEDFPWISNDLSSYDTSAYLSGWPTVPLTPLPVYPTDTTVYPTGTAEPAPTYGAPAPYPSSSGTSDQAPVPTSEAPGYGPPSAPGTTYAPVPTIATSYGSPVVSEPPPVAPPANGTVSEAPVPTASQTFVSAGNLFTVKLPVVLGALAFVFAML
jgi:hypothetical protein